MKKVNHSDQSAETPDEEVKSETADAGDAPEDSSGSQAEAVSETSDDRARETDDSKDPAEDVPEDGPEDGTSPNAQRIEQDPAVELENLRQQLLDAQEGLSLIHI